MVSYVKVCQVEVTRCELFVIVNIIQKGWIVSQRALLAENVVGICQQIVVSPVNLTSTSLIIITHYLAVDNISFLLFSAVWVRFVWSSTLLAERSGMQWVTCARTSFLIILAEPVAVLVFRSFFRHTDNSCLILRQLSLHSDRLRFKAVLLTRFTGFTGIRERANAFSILELRLGIPITHCNRADHLRLLFIYTILVLVDAFQRQNIFKRFAFFARTDKSEAQLIRVWIVKGCLNYISMLPKIEVYCCEVLVEESLFWHQHGRTFRVSKL